MDYRAAGTGFSRLPQLAQRTGVCGAGDPEAQAHAPGGDVCLRCAGLPHARAHLQSQQGLGLTGKLRHI